MRLQLNWTPALKLLFSLFLALTLAACGSSSDNGSRLNPNPGSGGGGGNGGDNGGGDGGGSITYRMGNGVGSGFTAGQIAVGIGDSALAPGGRTTLSVSVVSNNGSLIPQDISVDFSSHCIAIGAATIEPALSSNGVVTVEYVANGCVGADEITASSAVEGSVLSANTTLTVESDTVQTIQFVEATPNFINLKQTGGEEVSELRFRVVGATGAAMANVNVEFTLNQGSGDATLVSSSGVSGPDGRVSTMVQSGYKASTVRVTASIPSEGISTQSSQLVVSTGIPVQGRTSISASELHPVSWGTDGVESSINIRMADQFSNPVADGTAISFVASGGVIESGCITEDGACSVTWKSQEPRPIGSGGYTIDHLGNVTCPGIGECRNGRVFILATAIGNETFVDMNQNGRYDHDIDIFNSSGSTCGWNMPATSLSLVDPSTSTTACDDLGEAYLDTNFNGVRDSHEPVVDESGGTDLTTLYTAGNGIYDGILCSDESLAANTCTRSTVTIRADTMLVMTSPWAEIWDIQGIPLTIAADENTTIRFGLADINGNGLPAGTTISVDESLSNNISFTVFPSTLGASSEPSSIRIRAEADENEIPSGEASIVVTSGNATTIFTFEINP